MKRANIIFIPAINAYKYTTYEIPVECIFRDWVKCVIRTRVNASGIDENYIQPDIPRYKTYKLISTQEIRKFDYKIYTLIII